ncbi:hypothetical protein MKW92_040245, partial [Papaver armeniacum]
KSFPREMGKELIATVILSAYGNFTCCTREGTGWMIFRRKNRNGENLEHLVLHWE